MFKKTQVRVPWTVVPFAPHEVALSERCVGFLVEYYQHPDDIGLVVYGLITRDREGVNAVQSDDPNPPAEVSPLKYTFRLINDGDAVATEPGEFEGGDVKLWLWSEGTSVGSTRSRVAITLMEK